MNSSAAGVFVQIQPALFFAAVGRKGKVLTALDFIRANAKIFVGLIGQEGRQHVVISRAKNVEVAIFAGRKVKLELLSRNSSSNVSPARTESDLSAEFSSSQ